MLNSHKYAVLTAMLSAAGLLPMSAMADISFAEGGERLINTLHTHLYSPASGLSSPDEIKLAAVCFISDTKNCSDGMFGNTENNGGNGGSGGAPDYDLNDAERCRKEGYTLTSCAAGETPEGFCIYNSTYFSRCVCPASYKTCEPPYYGVGTACGDKYASCEEDTERACKELDSEFTDTCQTGWKVDPNNACKYDATFGKCCNLCEGYDYTTIPEGYIADGAACVDCNGTNKYKIKINPCDGFQDCGVMGGDTGAQTCMSGSQIKYDNCKPCPNLGTLSSCPSPFKCTYEECSNSYYKSGCQSGYDWDSSAKTCTAQCASTYQYTCTGANESPSGTACGGFYEKCLCSNGYFWNGSTCSDDNPCLKGLVLNFGDVLYSDMSHSYFSVASEIKHGKTPIGVVVCSYSNGGGQAIALNSIQNGQKIQFMAKYSGMPSQDGGTFTTPYRDVSSCRNSDKLMQARDKSYYPAVWAAAEYSTEGTKPGDWCLPAAGVLNAYFTRYSSNTSGFRALEAYGWQSSQLTTDNIVWTSTIQDDVYSPGYVLISYPQEGRYNSEYNNAYLGSQYVDPLYTNEVRPVIEFCTLGYRYDRKTYSCVDCGSAYKYSCRGLHEVGDVNKSCGGEYSECGCENGYKWNGNSCEEE